MSPNFSTFAADLSTRLTVETGWSWILDGDVLAVPTRGFALELGGLWRLAQGGAEPHRLVDGVLTALNAWDPHEEVDRLRVHLHTGPTAPEGASIALGQGLWLRLVLVLPLHTRVATPDEVPHALSFVHEAIRNTVRAPDAVVPLYGGGPLARYRGPDALDAAVDAFNRQHPELAPRSL